MPLAIGTRLGSYQIVAAIGAGGMGEVYRARDTKLDRDVAVKVLPSQLGTDLDARSRFESEAKAVAALSHPNILAIYDFGVHDGIAYAVTELLAGETLRARLTSLTARGAALPAASRLGDRGAAASAGASGLPLRKAIDIAIQIAHGLAAAHEKNIAHRDLKPENVFVCADGRVKILDFGLARQLAATDGDSPNSPTALRRTDPGTVLGTVGYMSPEQVKGERADQRSDIFSFGCVLFEMATGHQAFRRATAAETMTAILREEPLDMAKDGVSVPPALEPIVRHCLEKRPDERFQSARDLAFALQAQIGAAPSGREAAPAGGSPRRLRGAVRALAAGSAVALLAFVGGRYSSTSTPGTSTAAQALSFQQVTDMPGVETTPSLSPDGKNVVYASDASGNFDLYVMRIGGRTPVLLTGESPTDDLQPAWSPDGEHIAFRSERDGGGIFIMTSTGESVRRLTDVGFSPSWSPDGREIVVTAGTFLSPNDRGASDRGLWAVDVKSGQRRDISTVQEALQPSWSPHGWRIAGWGLRGASGQRDLWTIAADGSEAKRDGLTVTDDAAVDWSPAWSPDGAYLYFSSTRGGTMNLWRVPIDERTGRVDGEPEPLTTPSIWSGGLSFSRDGTRLAYASVDWRSTLFRAPFDATREAVTGTAVPILKSTRPIRDHEMSPDGHWVAFNETGVQEDVLVARTDASQYRRLTDDSFRDRAPTWSPDGRQIVFYSDRSGAYELWRIHPDASGLEQVTAFKGGVNFAAWAPDGSRLAFSGVGSDGWYLIAGDAKAIARSAPEPPIEAHLGFWPFSWSPDGTRLAGSVRRGEGSIAGLATYSLAAKRYTTVPGLAANRYWMVPAWLADNRRLLVRDTEGISVIHAETGARRPVMRIRGYAIGRSIGVSRDNHWITYTETGTEGDIWIATLKK